MKGRQAASFILSLLVVLSLLLSGLPGNAVSLAQGTGIVIDGVKEAAWGDPLALDPTGDMTEPNLDLVGLYVVEDATDYYIGFDATASTWGMTYGIYIDTDLVDGSGATTDPWGRAVNAVSAHLPEHTLYVYHEGGDVLQNAQLNHWTGSWSYDTLIDQGGAQGYDGAANDWIEYRVPKAALGNPARIALEVFTTGDSGHAQDTVPSDPNVAYTAPDWGPDVTTLSAFATFPLPSWYVAGDFNGWSSTADAMYDDGTHGDAVAGDGIHTAQIVIATAGRQEFKVTNDDGSVSYPPSGKSWFECTAGETVTFTFDGNTYSDGWLPATNIIGVSTEPGAWTAVGNWQGWDPGNAATAMTALGGGVYQLATTIAAPGSYEYKAVKTGVWDAIGADGRSVNANTVPFDIVEAGQAVTFTVDALGGRVLVELEPLAPQPAPDNNVWWDGLEHDSRDTFYRTPFGAVNTGTPITLRLRTYENDVTDVKVRVWNTALGGQTLYPMTQVATIPGMPYDYDIWELELAAPDYLTILYYRFIVTDGTDTDYYEDDDLFDGGLGQSYDTSPDYSYQVDVYDPALDTPDWFEDAVVYQIFPDRFRNGVGANDPISGTFFYDEDPGVLTAPQWNWPVPDPRVPGPWEGSYSKLFYGGDLQGIIDQLDYLHSLGVNTLYLNPIFESPSNHKYDTTDYGVVDDNFGDLATFQALVAALDARGMHLVLDGVFNHTSSDSHYFDRYGRYPGFVGACEDVNSPYRDWYYFYPANPPGTGVCAGDTTYNSWWGFDSLPKLNTTDEPEVRTYIYSDTMAIGTYWLNQGADGWRLDVAGDVAPSFWEEWRPYIEAADPNAVVIAEEWGDASRFVLGDQLDSTMNYRFRNAVIGLLRDTDWVDTNTTIPALTVSEFDSLMHSIEEDYPPEVWYTLMNLVDSHDTNRVLIPLDQDGDPTDANYTDGKARQRVLALIQMTMPGAPTIYYGDEVGLVGYGDELGGGTYYADPYNRQPYPWPDQPGYDTLPAWRQQDLDLHAYYQKLIAVRNANPVLRTGSFDTLLTDDANQLYVYGRKDVATNDVAIVIVNRDTVPHALNLDVSGYVGNGSVLVDTVGTLGGILFYWIGNGQLVVPPVPPMSGMVLTSRWGDSVPPAAPANLVATDGNGQVSLAWDAVGDAVSYNVYRSYVQGGGYELLASGVATTSYDDTTVENGRWYYYVVTAVDRAGNESENSNEATALPHVPIGWAGNLEPASISIEIGNPTPSIYAQVWVDGVTNAPGPGDGILAEIGYGPAAVPWEEWTTWTPMAYLAEVGNNDQYTAILVPEETGDYQYLARFSTTLGRDWTYALTGDQQVPVMTVLPSGDTTPPATPLNLTVLDWGATFVTLGWDPVLGDPTMYAYDVFRSDVSGTVGTMVGRVLSPTTLFTDTGVTSGQTYYYVVQAVDTSFNRSGYSNEVEATPAPKLVHATFEVTVPDWTPDGATVYIVGDIPEFCGWCNPQTVALNQVNDITWTRSFSLPDGINIQYKYSRGNWDVNEWWGPIVGVNNRSVTIDYGTTGTQLVADSVPYWRDPLVIDHDPLDGALDVDASATISVTLSRYLDPATIIADNLVLTSGTTTPTLDITWVHRTDMTATTIYLTPQSPLDPETVYTMNLLTGLAGLASDNEGIHLQQPYAWSFTTVAAIDVAINEVRIDQTGTDNDEYFELVGTPGGSLDGFTYLVIGDGTGASGVIEEVTDLAGQVISTTGYFVAAESTFTLGSADMVTDLNFENSDNVTHLLVRGFTGSDGQDLDTDDDGVLDVTPWAELIDLIALIKEDNPPATTEYHYGPPTVGPDGIYVPGHAFYCDPDWQIGQFDLVGGDDTPGMANICPVDIAINEVRIDQTGTDNDEYFELAGAPGASLDNLYYLVIGDGTGASGVIEEVTDLSSQVISTTGYFVAAESTFTLGSADMVTDLNFENSDNVTHLLVQGFTGSDGQDLDTDDDGVLDVEPWIQVVSLIALIKEDNPPATTEYHYGPPTVGPDGIYVPGHVYYCDPDWQTGQFDLVGGDDTPGVANICPVDIAINEVRIDQTGTDNDEYFELAGAPGASLDNLYYLVIGDGTGASGVIEEVTDLAGQVISTTGYFVAAESTFTLGSADMVTDLNFENSDNVTHLLVQGFTGSDGQDLDTDDDGVLDVEPWIQVVSLIALIKEDNPPATTEYHYGPPTVGPDGIYVPGHVHYCDPDWLIGPFEPIGGKDTPGAANDCVVVPPEACGDPYTSTYTIQGNGLASPLVGSELSVEAVVVGDFQNNTSPDDGDLGGFHIQDFPGDGDPATSDGIFVAYTGATEVAVGDRVRVHGVVAEDYGQTQINASEIWVCTTGNVVTPTAISLPVTTWDEYEPYEGMLVTLPQTLTIGEYFNFDRYGEIMLCTDSQIQPTALHEPGSPERAALALQNSLSRITLDDGRTSQNPDPAIHPNGSVFDMTNLFRGGDLVENVTGVLDYDYSLYRIQPTQGADYTPDNPRTAAPDAVGGTLKVAAFNVLNYFTTLDTGAWICGPSGTMECRGADTPEEFTRQRTKIITALVEIDADIVGLIEIENHATNVPVADLVSGLNAVLGAGTYNYISTGFIGTDAIQQALIYKPASVTPLGAYAILDSTVDPTFIDTLNRPVLAQTFVQTGTNGIFTVAVNHLKSKGSACPGDPDLYDGAGNCNLTRTAAATALVNWLATDPTGSGDADYLIIGDLNSYDKEDPIDALLAGGYTDLIHHFLGEYAYSYLFSAELGYLDYAMASAGLLAEVTGTTVWHINSDEPDLIDYDMSFKLDPQDALYAPDAYRASDHDPVIVGLDLVDELPPVLSVSVRVEGPSPDKGYATVVAEVLLTDDSDPSPIVRLVSVTSDNPALALSDSDVQEEIVIVDDYTFYLPLPLSGHDVSRVYTITYEVVDANGNSTLVSVKVTLPDDMERSPDVQ